MNMLQVHHDALSEEQTTYHEFLGRFKRNSKNVYGFVEGKEDPLFYAGFIENSLPDEWLVDLWSVGSKERVIKLHARFNWKRFPRERIMFFIDRDLSVFLNESLPVAKNVYITDNYSIENDVVNRNTCGRVLTEVCNLTSISKDDRDQILDLFDTQLKVFRDKMIPVMAWIIHWKRSKKKPSLDDICMDHIFKFKNGTILPVRSPKGLASVDEYIHKQCNIKMLSVTGIGDIEKEFRSNGGPAKFIRGKYELWFMVHFILSVHKAIGSLSRSVPVTPKIHVSFGMNNAIILVGPRARIPKSLSSFLNKTCIKFVRGVGGSS